MTLSPPVTARHCGLPCASERIKNRAGGECKDKEKKMIRVRVRMFNRLASSDERKSHTEKVMRITVWFLFVPVYVRDRILGTNL